MCAANQKRYSNLEKQSVWKRVYYCIVHVFVWFLCVYGIERGMVVGVLFLLKRPKSVLRKWYSMKSP